MMRRFYPYFDVFSVLCCVHVSGVAVFQAPWLIWLSVLIDLVDSNERENQLWWLSHLQISYTESNLFDLRQAWIDER